MATLHLTRTHHALMPNYVSRFRCIGSSCEDTCCSGWTVALDKKTFNTYRQSKHPELSKLFESSLRRQRSQGSDRNYGKIDLNGPNGCCPMMKDGLCGVQLHMNESHLSNTCYSYPRISANFGGQHQQALQLSCPEAARQALLAPDAFDFIEGPITVRQETVQQVDAGSGLTTQIMHDARIFCLQLMRVQGLETWQRLALLGVFCEKLTGCLARRDQAAVPALMDEFAGLVESGAVIDALRDLQANHEAQALVFATLWSHKEAPARTERQRAVVAAVATNLGADAETGVARIEDLVAAYAQGVKRLPQALEAAPHLLDHYLLNEMFMHMFPFEGGGDPYHSYLQLVSRYGLLRLMLAAQCVGDGPLPDADTLVTTVQVYCRRFRHDVHFAQRVNHALRNGGWESLDKLYSFLRH